ncbi:MAG: non-homologous end-joining DNA ligase [Mycobacteriaceae bacterium]
MGSSSGGERVSVAGRELRLTNLDKELYPGVSKAEVIQHYVRVAPVLLPHLAGRPVTLRRWPDGVGSASFVQKHTARDTPGWVRTELVGGRGHTPVRHAVLEEPAALVWAANLAALELHVPQWRFDAHGQPQSPDLLVLDLDPGQPADVTDCARVALRLREELSADGLTAYAKTSGGKGLHVLVPVCYPAAGATSAYAKAMAQRLAADDERVVWQMTRALRPGKVLLDWSQNNPAKTTVVAYSLRGGDTPTVSTPVTWDEVAAVERADQLRFSPAEVAARVARDGDLLAAMDDTAAPLPA